MSLLQIHHWVCQWKYFENRLTFGEVIAKSLLSFFSTHGVLLTITYTMPLLTVTYPPPPQIKDNAGSINYTVDRRVGELSAMLDHAVTQLTFRLRIQSMVVSLTTKSRHGLDGAHLSSACCSHKSQSMLLNHYPIRSRLASAPGLGPGWTTLSLQ